MVSRIRRVDGQVPEGRLWSDRGKVAHVRVGGLVHNVVRVSVSVLGAVAMTYQFAKLNGAAEFSEGNFFSFFTIQSNIFAATMLVMAALVRRNERSLLFDAVRGAATFYITITFAVFALFLSGLQEQLDTHISFVNFVVHYFVPVVLLVDWFLDPPQHRLGLRVAAAWLAYPVVWFAYTLVRGGAVDWYPYPFVDVARHGHGRVLANGFGFTLAFALGAVLFTTVSDRRSGSRRGPAIEAS